jgi:hypothetical protein
MSKNKLFLINIAIIMVIGLFVADSLTISREADIQFDEWAQHTNEDGTLFYSTWGTQSSLAGSKVIGFGVQISRVHNLRRKVVPGPIHLFDSQESAIRFALESDIPRDKIIFREAQQ